MRNGSACWRATAGSPVIFARTDREEGVRVVAVAHEGETEPDLAEYVEAITWVKVGQLRLGG